MGKRALVALVVVIGIGGAAKAQSRDFPRYEYGSPSQSSGDDSRAGYYICRGLILAGICALRFFRAATR